MILKQYSNYIQHFLKATGIRIGYMMQTISNLGIGIGLGFGYSWSVTLVIIGFLPCIIVSAVLQAKMLTGFSKMDKKNLEDAGKITNEAITNIRTVANLAKEKYFFDSYATTIDIPYK